MLSIQFIIAFKFHANITNNRSNLKMF